MSQEAVFWNRVLGEPTDKWLNLTREPHGPVLKDRPAGVEPSQFLLDLIPLLSRDCKVSLQLTLQPRMFIREANEPIEILYMGDLHGVRIAQPGYDVIAFCAGHR